jgi:hypothetical protein
MCLKFKMNTDRKAIVNQMAICRVIECRYNTKGNILEKKVIIPEKTAGG